MRKFIMLFLMSLLIASPVMAQEVDISGMSPEQIHLMQVYGDQLKAQKPVKIQKINEYTILGKGIAEALSEAAKQLGVTVNDFVRMPVGQVTTALIVYKIIGHDVIHIALGLLWILVSTSIWLFFYSKLWAPEEVTINYAADGKTKLRMVKINSNSSIDSTDPRIWLALGPIVIIGVSLVTFLT